MACKYIGWLINQGIAWCNKDNKRNPFKDCENCPYREEFEWGETETESPENFSTKTKGDA